MFINKWEQVVSKKDSILCVGLDPAEKAQSNQSFPSSYDKFSWCMKMIEEISPHTAAEKKQNRLWILYIFAAC
jgi:orotidine-5'-phosphate decarboxylase